MDAEKPRNEENSAGGMKHTMSASPQSIVGHVGRVGENRQLAFRALIQISSRERQARS